MAVEVAGKVNGKAKQTVADRIVRLAGKAIADFNMIRAGDRIAVGLSGGKDSMALLHALCTLQKRAPIDFDLMAFTIQQGKFLSDPENIRGHVAELGVPWRLVEDAPSVKLVQEGVVHGCDICSRYRRRAVYEVVREMGCGVIAFGHTADDFAEGMVRNVVYTGKVKPLPPITMSSKQEFRIIRPLMYVKEELIRAQATQSAFPIVPCACSLKEGARTKVRAFLRDLSDGNPHIYSNVIRAAVKSWEAQQQNSVTDED
jgi:tRNA 2-thiocytidine biosynthesis protein TtcA